MEKVNSNLTMVAAGGKFSSCKNEWEWYNLLSAGRGSARIERTVRVREVGGSNPPAPTRNSPDWESFLVKCPLVIKKNSKNFYIMFWILL